MTLFDLAEAERRRDEGMAHAAARRAALLAIAQDCAFAIAQREGTCDSDRVAERMAELGHDYDSLGNAAGSVFRARQAFWRWEWTGEARRSARPSTHARVIRVWRLARCEP
jgi:hypothetical protein